MTESMVMVILNALAIAAGTYLLFGPGVALITLGLIGITAEVIRSVTRYLGGKQ